MIAKCFEVRDAATFIPVMAVKLSHADWRNSYLLRRAGYRATQEGPVFLTRLSDGETYSEAFRWKGQGRTMPAAHEFIEKHFEALEPGAVVDIEFILGETKEPKLTERVV